MYTPRRCAARPRGSTAHLSVRRTRVCCAAACNGGEHVTLGAEPVTISVVDYTRNMNCTWAISGVPPIELTVTSLDTEADYDYVTVYDGQKMLREYTGSVLPPPLRVMDAAMTVTFASDGSTNAKGFVAVLKAIPGAPLPMLSPLPRARLHLHYPEQACALTALAASTEVRMPCSHASANSSPIQCWRIDHVVGIIIIV